MPAQANWDVIVIGGGIAGVSAAAKLADAGLTVCLLEARDRLGGRIFTRRDPVTNAPLELGAEFIHGRPHEIWDLVGEHGITPVEMSGEDWCEREGILQPCDLFSTIQDLLGRMDDQSPDESFLDFLQRCWPDASDEAKQRARAYITGFHAADPALISVHSLVRSQRADAKIDGDRAFRLPEGYQVLIDIYRKRLQQQKVAIYLDTVVQGIDWERAQVRVTVHSAETHTEFRAPRVLVTLPLAVLQSGPELTGAVRFVPALPGNKQSALQKLAMGRVIRVTLRFKERFWERLQPNGQSRTLAHLRFLFSNQNWFPTWWTTMPERIPVITGWAPFHCAEDLSAQDPSMVFASAREALCSLLQVSDDQMEDWLEGASWHDWQVDPFSRGAYSYVKVGGDGAQQDLAAPVENTLFFAGEATDTSGFTGTVHGAIASAQRAAAEIINGLHQ